MSEEEQSEILLAKQGSITLFGNVTGKIFGFLFVAVATRIVTPGGYGIFVLATSLTTFIHSLISLNIYGAADYFVPQFLNESNYSKAKGVLRNILVIGLVFSVLGSIAVYLLRFTFAEWFEEPALVFVLLPYIVLIPLLTIYKFLSHSFNSIKKMKYRALMRNIINPVIKIVASVVFISLGAGVGGLIGGYIFGIAVAVLCGSIFLLWEAEWLQTTSAQSVSSRSLLSYALPLAMAGVVYTIIGQIDTFLIGAYRPSSEVGYYDVAYLLAANLLIALNAVTPVFKPMIAEVKPDRQMVRDRYQLATRWVTMLTLPPAITLFLAPDLYLKVLFTQEYVVASRATIALVLGYLVNAASGPEGMVLEGLGHTKITFLNSVVLLGINTILGVLLIPRLGIFGAAVATAVALSSVSLLGIAELYHIQGCHPFHNELLRVYVAISIPFLIGEVVKSTVSSSIVLAITLPLSVIIFYIIGLRAFGGFSSKDIRIAEAFDDKIGYNILSTIIK